MYVKSRHWASRKHTHCNKRLPILSFHSRDVTNRTLPGPESTKLFPARGRVWLVTSRLGTWKLLTFFYSARTDLSPGGIVLGPFVVAGLQTDCVRTVRMEGVGIHVPGGDTLALALYTHHHLFTFANQMCWHHLFTFANQMCWLHNPGFRG